MSDSEKPTVVTSDVEKAAAYIRAGELVAFPTETVFGLGADALHPDAVAAIFDAKGRPADNPLIVHIADRDDIYRVAESVSDDARLLIDAFFPGPCTLVVKKKDIISNAVTAGLSTVGVRMPDHEIARSFIRASGGLVAAPSANRSGAPSATTWEAVQEDLGGKIACILKGERAVVGLESTVIDCTVSPPVILRPGSIGQEDLQRVLLGAFGIEIRDTAEAKNYSEIGTVRSPGTLHPHYKPRARVQLIDSMDQLSATRGSSAQSRHRSAAYIGLSVPPVQADLLPICVCKSVEHYAYALFNFFRTCDKSGVDVIYCERVQARGLGGAVMDRLTRAASSDL